MVERTPRILVVDDDRVTRALLEEILAKEGYKTETADSGESALEKVRSPQGNFDLVISDIRMGGKSGLDLLREIRKSNTTTEVILITGFGSMETAVEAVREGAFDYVSKPFKIDEIKLAVKRAIHARQILESGNLPPTALASGPGRIVGRTRPMIEVFKLVAKVALGRSTVLVVGESGTGKELVARAIHAESNRRDKPFVPINSAAIPEALLESELFGHVKGAFTTAIAEKTGLFEDASGGTLFLDEIGDMPLVLQAKLLRAIEFQEIKRVGANAPIKIDVRIIAATNKSLPEMVKEGSFREDLYFRLNVVMIEVPPLRDRKDDIPLLAEHFLATQSAANNKRVLGITPETGKLLLDYPWPGNVRELAHVIERAVALSGKPLLLPDDLPPYVRPDPAKRLRTLEEVERDYILEVLRETRGNKVAAATILHIDRKTLQRKMQSYHIQLEGSPAPVSKGEPEGSE